MIHYFSFLFLDFFLLLSFIIYFIIINICIENSIPNSKEGRVIPNVLGVMERVIRCVSTKGKNSEDAERKLVAGVRLVGLEVAEQAPEQQRPLVSSSAEEEWTSVPRQIVDEDVLDRVVVLASDAGGMDELVMLLMEHLIHR